MMTVELSILIAVIGCLVGLVPVEFGGTAE